MLSPEPKRIKDLTDLKDWIHQTLMPCLRGAGPQVILCLEGPMGVGKTQAVRLILEALGADEGVQSPSFAIHNRYDFSNGHVDHVDLFRLENEEDLESTGFWDLLAQPKALLLIEWPERLPKDSLPPHWSQFKLKLDFVEEQGGSQERELLLKPQPD